LDLPLLAADAEIILPGFLRQ